MGDLDPLTKKVADVFDGDGRRIGSIRSTEMPEATSGCIVSSLLIALVVGVIAFIIAIPLGVYEGAKALIEVVPNGLLRGEWTRNDDKAAFANAGGPSAQINRVGLQIVQTTLSPERFDLTAKDEGNQDTTLSVPRLGVTIRNDSDTKHTISFSTRATYVFGYANGDQKTRKDSSFLSCEPSATNPQERASGTLPAVNATVGGLVYETLAVEAGATTTIWYSPCDGIIPLFTTELVEVKKFDFRLSYLDGEAFPFNYRSNF